MVMAVVVVVVVVYKNTIMSHMTKEVIKWTGYLNVLYTVYSKIPLIQLA